MASSSQRTDVSSIRKIPNDYSHYTVLDSAKNEIRLLRIEAFPSPGANSRLVCSLVGASLGSPPPYSALSYCWGDLEKTVSIIVEFDDSENFCTSNVKYRGKRSSPRIV